MTLSVSQTPSKASLIAAAPFLRLPAHFGVAFPIKCWIAPYRKKFLAAVVALPILFFPLPVNVGPSKFRIVAGAERTEKFSWFTHALLVSSKAPFHGSS